MSPLDRPVPPAGEEIHIPGPSAQPLLLTIGITVALLGVTTSWLLWVPGVILTVVVLAAWIRDAKREYDHLPLEHATPVQETARPEDRPQTAAE
jgi:hypothetical protein